MMRKFGIGVLVVIALGYLTTGSRWDSVGQIIRGFIDLLPSISIQ
jgi:hypothetical protein